AIDSRRTAHGRVELTLDLFVESGKNCLFANRRKAIRRRRHDLRVLDSLIERFRNGTLQGARLEVGRNLGGLADFAGQLRRHTAKVAGQESGYRMALGIL